MYIVLQFHVIIIQNLCHWERAVRMVGLESLDLYFHKALFHSVASAGIAYLFIVFNALSVVNFIQQRPTNLARDDLIRACIVAQTYSE